MVLFSAFTILSGSSITRRPPQLRETQVIDYHPDHDLVHGRSLSSLLTLTRNEYAVSAVESDGAVSTFIHSNR